MGDRRGMPATPGAGDFTQQTAATLVPTSSALVANRSGLTIVGHRGGGGIWTGGYYQGPYPEETLEGFAAAYAAGVRWFNPHACMLADGSVTLMHDNTPDRTTDATTAVGVADYTSQAWRKLKVTPQNTTLWPGYGVDWGEMHPPFLDDYLAKFGGVARHIIECSRRGAQSNGDVATAVLALLRARGLLGTAIIQAFAAGELTPAAAAGVETMFLPPDLGTASSDAASILATMAAASGWAAGKPKHVGINSAPTGQTQAQVITYIGTLVAAGLTVWAYSITRRYDRDWLAAAGVSGIIADEPVYLGRSTRLGTVDALKTGVWPHGFLHSDQAHGRGRLLSSGVQLDYSAGSTGTQFCCYGAFSPPTSLTAYTLQADWAWDTLDTDATRHADLAVCAPDDRPTSTVIGTGQGVVDGYLILLRQSGAALAVSRTNRAAQTITGLLTQTTGLPPAPSAGTVTTMRVQVTSTQLIITLIQGATTYGPWTVTDSTYRGGYFHLGRAYGSGTKLTGTWKNISLG